MLLDADSLISHLQLKPHPEGGFYAETYRSTLTLNSPEHDGPRTACTGIYFLLRRQDMSAFHRVRSDELWHHYLGDTLELLLVDEHGGLSEQRLGSDFARGERPQALAPRNVLQAARVVPSGPHGFVLCGCTVAPGFEFGDFELPSRASLSARFPEHAALFAALCH